MDNSRNRKNRLRIFVKIIITVIYLIIMFWLLFLGENRAAKTRSYNLKPLASLRYFIDHTLYRYPKIVIINILGNFIVFIPAGFAMASLMPHLKYWKLLLFLLVALCLIEFSQYVFGVGVMDIDDVILNFMGGCFGLYLHHIKKNMSSRKLDNK